MTSGIRVLALIKWDRRSRFILAASLAFGLGNLLVPTAFTHLFDDVTGSEALVGFCSSLTIVISTPCRSPQPPFLARVRCSLTRDLFSDLIGGLVGVVLNLILPFEADETANLSFAPDVEVGHELAHSDATEEKKDASKKKDSSSASGSIIHEVK